MRRVRHTHRLAEAVAEQGAAITESFQERVLDAASSSIVVTDPNLPDNPVVYVNSAFERETGYSSEEAVGHNCRFLQGSERDQPALGELREALGEGREFSGVLRNYRKSGELFYNELSISPVRDGEDRLTHFIGVQRDVTGRVEAEQERKSYGRELNTIFESITDAFFALDREWRFTYLNSEAERVLFRKREELLGQNVWEEFPEAAELSFYPNYYRAMDEGVTVEFEEYYPPLETWFEVKAYPSELGISVYFRDINLRKQAEQERKESEERLRSVLVGYGSELITILGPEGYVTYESPALEHVLGKKPEEHIGESGLDLIHPDDRERVSGAFAAAIEEDEATPTVEYRLQHADGTWHYFEGIANNLLDEAGIEGLVVNSRDVTGRKQAEEQQARLASFPELNPAPVIEMDPSEEITYTNPATLASFPDLPELGSEHPVLAGVKSATEELTDNQSIVREVKVGGSYYQQVISYISGVDRIRLYVTEVSERKEAEKALAESEERFRALSEATFEGIIITSGGQVLEFNNALTDTFGYDPSEVVGKLVFEFLAPESRELVQHKIVTESGEPYEAVGIRKDGTRIDIEICGRQSVYKGQTVRVAAVRDITGRKQAEEMNRRLAGIVESTDDAIISRTLDGTITSWNSGAERLYDYSAEEMIGETLSNHLYPSDRLHDQQEISGTIQRGEVLKNYETARVAKDGRRIEVSLTVSPIRDAEGNVVGDSAIVRDITERKRTEELLQRQLAAMNNSIDGIAILDQNGEYVYVNEAHARIYGYEDREELIGKSWQALYPEDELDRFERHVMPALGEHGQWRGEATGRRRDGTTFAQELSLTTLGDGGLVCVVRDVTQRKRREEELRESSSRLGTLIESLQAGILVEDDTRHISRVNQEFCEMFGIPAPPQDLVGTDCSNAAEDSKHLFEEPEKFVRGVEERIREKRPVTGEEFSLVDGRTFERDYVPIFVDEDYRGHLWQYRDITGRKEAEQTLAESEARFRTLFDQTAIGVCVADLDRRLIETNAAYQEITGYSGEELAGMTTLELTHPDDRAGDTGVSRIFASDESDSYQREKRYVRKDGGVVWASAASSIVRDESGEPRFIMGVVEDVTDRKQAEEEIRMLSETLAEQVADRTADLQDALTKNERAVVRESALRSASVALVAAADREGIYAAALEAVLPFIDEAPGTRVSVWTGTGEKDFCVEASGDNAEELEGKETYINEFPDRVRDPLLEGQSVQVSPGEAANFQHAFRFETKLGALFMVPLCVRGQFEGRIVVASDSALP
ncbi:hypothetical protein BH24ACT21_BH24ACT21_06970 [soil metagenome]